MASPSPAAHSLTDSFTRERPSLAGFVWVYGVLLGGAGIVVSVVVSSFFSGSRAWIAAVTLVLAALVLGVWRARVFYFSAAREWVQTLQLEDGDAVVTPFELKALIHEGLPRASWGTLPVPVPKLWIYASGGPALFAFRAPGSPQPQVAISRAALTSLSAFDLRRLILEALLLALRVETPRYTASAALALRLSKWVGEGWLHAAFGGEKLGRVTPEGFLRFLLVYPAVQRVIRRNRVDTAIVSARHLGSLARLQPSGSHWALAPLSLSPLASEKIVLSPPPGSR